jgi:hypothetical protein
MRKSSGSDEPRVFRARPAVVLFRTCAAHARAFATRTTPEAAARAMFGDADQPTAALTRAASTQATTTDPTWAGALARQAVDDTIAAVASVSAGADLLTRGRKVDMTGISHLTVPGRIVNAAAAGSWVAEGNPIPVSNQAVTAGAVIEPRKLAVISTFSSELAASSNVEEFTRTVVSESMGLALDAAMFSNAVDDGAHPAGLFHNVAPLTATAGGGLAAMQGDLKALAAALAAAGGGKNPVIVAAVPQAMTLKLTAGPLFVDAPILASTALATGIVAMIEASSLVSGFAAVPQFSRSDLGALHMSDTPTDISGAVPVKSMWQEDLFALKTILRGSWSMRAPHVAYITDATW